MSHPRRSTRAKVRSSNPDGGTHRPVRERWFYEPVVSGAAEILLARPLLVGLSDSTGGLSGSGDTALPECPGRVISSDSRLAIPGLLMLGAGEQLTLSQSPVPWPLRLTSAGPTGRFVIRLIFPGGELPDQLFMVTSSMTVSTLARALAQLMQISSTVSMYVAPV